MDRLQKLQSMSDDDLNELAAVKVMGWKVERSGNVDYAIYRCPDGTYFKEHAWNPTTDLNDAMEVWNELYGDGWELSLSCDQKITFPWDCRMFWKEQKRVISHEKTASRAITIAAILAKESKQG